MHGFAEVIRAARAIHPFFQNEGMLTLQLDQCATSPAWSTWRDSIWLGAIAPALLGTRGTAKTALIQLDLALDRALPAEASRRSRLAGQKLSSTWTAPHGEKRLRAWSQTIASENTPGHLAILWAIRAEMFHYSPEMIASTYLLLEAQGAMTVDKNSAYRLADMMGDCLIPIRNTGESRSILAA